MNILKLCLLLFFFSCADQVYAVGKELSMAEKKSATFPDAFLKTIKWDEQYESQRAKELDIIFDNINQKELIKDVSDIQRKTIINSLKANILKQLMLDKDYYRKKLIGQYSQFFTPDELLILLHYYKTKLMQKLITAKIENKPINKEDIVNELKNISPQDEQAVNSFRDSYIKARLERFQENMNTAFEKLIQERVKEIFATLIKQLPSLINQVKSSSAAGS